MYRVAIIQKEIPHYRIRFLDEVCSQAFGQGLDVTIYSAHICSASESFKFAHTSLPVYQFKSNKNGPFWMKGLTAALAETNIIVAPQELKCLNVPYLWAMRHRLRKKLIWWGHGYNFQASDRPFVSTYLKEAVKRFMTRRADGIITYTAMGAEYWRQRGIPADQVIPYYNTIDVEELRRAGAAVSEQQLMELRQKLGINGKRVLLFSSRLYPKKKVDFLLRAFGLLKKTFPAVTLLIIGDGKQRSNLERLAAKLELQDVHFLGELMDPKASTPYFSLAELMVIPGLVGLSIVHGYAFGLPIITTEHRGQGPEIEYLVGDAGVITEPNESDFALAIASILGSRNRLTTMRQAALAQGDTLYLPPSVRRFVDGIRLFASHSSYPITPEQ